MREGNIMGRGARRGRPVGATVGAGELGLAEEPAGEGMAAFQIRRVGAEFKVNEAEGEELVSVLRGPECFFAVVRVG